MGTYPLLSISKWSSRLHTFELLPTGFRTIRTPQHGPACLRPSLPVQPHCPTAPFLTLWVPDTLNAFGLLSGPCSLLPRMFAQVIHCAWEPLPPSLPTSTNEGSNSPNLFCKFLLQNCAVREVSPGLKLIRSPLSTLTVPGPSPCSSRHNCTVLIPCTE